MQWPREDACAGQPRRPHMLLARQQSSRTSPRTNWVRPPMRSRPHVLPPRKERARAQGGSSAGGSATRSRRRFASSYSTTSGCGTTSVGRCSTAESASGHLSLHDESCCCLTKSLARLFQITCPYWLEKRDHEIGFSHKLVLTQPR